MAGLDFCSITNILAADFVSAITTINRKFISLQRLAQLIQQAGAGVPVPNLSGLISPAIIDLSAYNRLVAACPFLNLPFAPTASDLAQLQAQVIAAMNGLLQTLNAHPFARLGLIQNQMAKIAAEVNSVLAAGEPFLQCLVAACGGNLSMYGLYSPGFASDQLAQFKSGYAASGGNVLTPSMQANAAAIANSIATINALLAPQVIPPALPPQLFEVPIPTDHPIPPPPFPGVI